MFINSLPDDKFYDWSKFKAFADDKKKINVNYKQKCFFGMGRKHCGKRRKCWLPAFSPFPQCFQKASLSGSLKGGIERQRVNEN